MENLEYELEKLEKYFLINLIILLVLGVIMVFSSSYILAKETYGTSAYFLYKQLTFLSVAAVGAFIISKTKYQFWIKYSAFIHICVGILLALTFVPGFGSVVKGANRWISIAGFSIQPGELVKYTTLLFSLQFFEKFNGLTLREKFIFAAILFAPFLAVVAQPDFGTFSICFMVASFVCFMSPFPRKYFYSGIIGGAILAVFILISQPYRVQRLLTFMDPWKNPLGSGFQIIQSYMGFANGSVWGLGLGNSNEKLFYLPEAHNDFIFSVIGEELGFLGVVFTIILFLSLIYLGFRIATKLADRVSLILASSIIFVIGLQALLNMGVVLGLLPTKGLNLPFISSGGSSLLANIFAIGLFFAITRQSKEKIREMSSLHSSSTTGFQSRSRENGQYESDRPVYSNF